jgi:DNA-binding CsgD family transcriptional regulator
MAALVDRDAELGAGARFLAAARAAGAALIVEGPAGIGKSALVRALAGQAREDGFEVLSCAGLEGEEELDYASLSELIAALVDAGSPGLPVPQRTALEIALARVEPGEMTPDRLAVSLACARLFEVAARDAPLLVIVDDEQWLDGATRDVLRLALRRTAAHAVGWLIGRRSDLPGPAPLDAERALPAEAVMRVQPGPITCDAVSRLVAERVVGRWSPATIEQIHSASAGNPLAAIEIARELRRRASPAAVASSQTLPLPASLADALRARVASLSAAAREAGEAVAVLPRASYEAVALLAGEDAATGLAEAEARELLVREPGSVAFAHPLLRLAIDDGMSRPRRAHLHLRAAGIVLDHVDQALHLALGHVDPDASVAERAATAAVAARERNATAIALALLEHALRLTPPGEHATRDARRADLSEALLGAGEYERAASLIEGWLGDTARGASRARLLVSHGALQLDREQLIAVLADAAENAAADPSLRAWIELSTAMPTGFERHSDLGIEHASRARELAAELGDGELEATTQAILGMFASVAARDDADALVEDAVRRAPDPTSRYDMYLQPRMAAGLVALWAGRLDAAAIHLTALSRAFERWGVAQHTAFIALHLAELHWRTGEWDRGLARAESLWRFDTEAGGAEPGLSDYARALLLAARGDAGARLTAESGLRASEQAGDRIFALQNRVVLGFLESSLADHAAALRWLDPVPAALEELGVRNPGAYPFAPDLLEALVAAGRIEDAERLVAWLDRATRAGNHPWARCMAERGRGLILLGQGEHDGAVRQLEHALQAHDALPVPHERARALLLLGGAQRRARRRSDAAATLEQSITAFQGLGSPNFEARAQDERRRLGLRNEQDELTATELRVARLVADGFTNKEVATTLFMSTKTVEANLTRIYRTLGLRSRSELARHLSQGEG